MAERGGQGVRSERDEFVSRFISGFISLSFHISFHGLSLVLRHLSNSFHDSFHVSFHDSFHDSFHVSFHRVVTCPAASADDARPVAPVVDDFPKKNGVGLRLRRRGSLVALASLHMANSVPSSSMANSTGRRTGPCAPTAVQLLSALGQWEGTFFQALIRRSDGVSKPNAWQR